MGRISAVGAGSDCAFGVSALGSAASICSFASTTAWPLFFSQPPRPIINDATMKHAGAIVFFIPNLSLRSNCGPDTAIVGWHCKRCFLQWNDSTEIKLAAVEFFDVVAADWKPKRYCLIGIAGVDRDESVRRAVVTSE